MAESAFHHEHWRKGTHVALLCFCQGILPYQIEIKNLTTIQASYRVSGAISAFTPCVDIHVFTVKLPVLLLKPRHPKQRDVNHSCCKLPNPSTRLRFGESSSPNSLTLRKVRYSFQALTTYNQKFLREELEVLHHLQATCSS